MNNTVVLLETNSFQVRRWSLASAQGHRSSPWGRGVWKAPDRPVESWRWCLLLCGSGGQTAGRSSLRRSCTDYKPVEGQGNLGGEKEVTLFADASLKMGLKVFWPSVALIFITQIKKLITLWAALNWHPDSKGYQAINVLFARCIYNKRNGALAEKLLFKLRLRCF